MTQKYKVIRLLEYVGTIDFLRGSIERRSVKGSHRTGNGVIREAFLGEFPFGYEEAEALPEAGLEGMGVSRDIPDTQAGRILKRLVDVVKPQPRWPCPYCGQHEGRHNPRCWYCIDVEPIVQEYEGVLKEDREGTL